MYPKLVDQITGGIAKAVQKATDSHAFSEFPECSTLAHTDRLSIKLKDTAQLPLHQSAGRFDSATFVVRDEDHQKREIMSAQVQQGGHHGLLLKNEAAKSVMLIRTSQSADSLGKLVHPSQATLFKLVRAPDGLNFCLIKASSDESVVMRVEKVLVSLQAVGKAVGLLNSNCVYWVKDAKGTAVLGHIRTKLVLNSNTLVVKFMSTQRNVQLRAAMLGVAVLLMASEVFPEFRTMLSPAESTQTKFGQPTA